MATGKTNFRTGGRLYLLLIPAMLGCATLMAVTINTKSALQDNETNYKGNILAWRYTDTLSYSRKTRQAETVAANSKLRKPIIYRINSEPVYRNEYLSMPAAYGLNERAYPEYIRQQFSALCKNTADSLANVNLVTLIIDKNGKVVYYQAKYNRPYTEANKYDQYVYPFGRPEPVLHSFIEKIIQESPAWKPAKINGKAVNSLISYAQQGC